MNVRAFLRSLLPSPPTLSDAEADRVVMDRRAFLRLAGVTGAGVVVAPLVDLEQLLWTPSTQIVIPELPVLAPGGNVFLTADWVTREALRVLQGGFETVKMVNRQYDEAWPGARVAIHNAHPRVELT